jgi:hypothetical protein
MGKLKMENGMSKTKGELTKAYDYPEQNHIQLHSF